MSIETTIVTCVYCGFAYPENTPTWNSIVLTEHIKSCDKHPMRKVVAERDRLRAALVGLVGASAADELKAMEMMMRSLPAPAEDKEATINAIHALLATA